MTGNQDFYYWLFSGGIPFVGLLALGLIVRTQVQRRTGTRIGGKWLAGSVIIVACVVFGQAGFERLAHSIQDRIAVGYFLLFSVWLLTDYVPSRVAAAADP